MHWRLRTPARDPETLRALRRARAIATLIAGGDPSAMPMVHPLRWPGSWNRKTDTPVMARIIEENTTAIDLAEALAALGDAAEGAGLAAPKQAPRTPRAVSGQYHGSYVHAALVGIAGKLAAATIGERHPALTAAAARMFELGLSDTYVEEFISDAASKLNELGGRQITDGEVDAILAWADGRASGGVAA